MSASFLLAAFLLLPAPSSCAQGQVSAGIDVLSADGFKALQGKRVGLITNPTGRDRSGKSTARLLAEAPGVSLSVIFAPEHGITGDIERDDIAHSEIALAGRMIPVRSLAPLSMANMRPKPEDLDGLDAVVFDIQDIGASFYTYLATMGMAMEETAKAGVEMIVLDRPNPLTGDIVEGPIADGTALRRVCSTAYYPVAIRHGMTAGEIATLYAAEIKHPKLTVVKIKGWNRAQWYDQTGLAWTPPSPNIPDLDAAIMYPGIGLFEPGNFSVGRGTPEPFRWMGAPWMKAEKIVRLLKSAGLAGVRFQTQDYTPSKNVYKGRLCRGVRFTVTDRSRLRPTRVFRALASALRRVHFKEVKWRWTEVKYMIGSDGFRKIWEEGADPARLERFFEDGARRFEAARKPYLLY